MFSKCLLVLFTALLLLAVSECRRGGGGRSGGGRSSSRGSSSRGGWFSRSSSSSSSRSSSSSSSGGFGTGSKANYPKQQWSSGGTKPKTPIGGGGFVNPKATSYGSSFGGAKTNSYKSPGYGTNFGTSFKGGNGRYGGKGFSKKALGLGVGAGFIGGAALGVAGTVATMGVYHRYLQYRLLLGGLGWNSHYYNNYYYNNHCFGGCPWAAHCEWGFCECNRGYERSYGSCVRDGSNPTARPNNFNPFVSCTEGLTCQRIDMNLICNTNLTTSGEGRCQCRQDMKWNEGSGECQLFLDVDCSSITYDTKPSPVILEAVNKTLENLETKNDTETETSLDTKADNATLSASPNVTLSNSLLSSIDPNKASKADINEAFCRDVDSFSWEFNKPERYSRTSGSESNSRSVGSIIGIVVGVIAFFTICCLCCVCCVCKGAKDKLSGVLNSDDKQNNQTGVTFSSIQEGAGPGYNYNGYPANQQSYPPQGPGGPEGLPYSVGPPVIPPTQPGYSNYPPDYSSQQSPYQPPSYPPNNPVPYPAQPAPYPPPSQAPYNPGY